MSSPGQDHQDGYGDYTFACDWSREQHLFLRSVQERVPEVLQDLKKSVLPLFAAARTRGKGEPGSISEAGVTEPLQPTSSGEWLLPEAHPSEHLPVGATVGLVTHMGISKHVVPPWDGTITPPETWAAIWKWAGKFHLVDSKEVEMLKTGKAFAIATEMHRDYQFRSLPHHEGVEPFSIKSSSVTFALPVLIRVVSRTLWAWSDGGGRPKLKWHFPEPDLTVHEQHDLDYLDQLGTSRLSCPLTKKLMESNDTIRGHEVPPFVYKFSHVKAWNMRRETRAEAEGRILEVLTQQMRTQMEQHEKNAVIMGLEKHPRQTSGERHYDWLALYQVKKMSFLDIAQQFQLTWRDQKTPLKHRSEAIRAGVNDAAEYVIGKTWRSWLRRGTPGRPKRSQNQ